MRHSHTASPSRLANAALYDPDGYVETLLELARDQRVARGRHSIVLDRPSRLDQHKGHTPTPSRLQ
jgi:hypothetical protein